MTDDVVRRKIMQIAVSGVHDMQDIVYVVDDFGEAWLLTIDTDVHEERADCQAWIPLPPLPNRELSDDPENEVPEVIQSIRVITGDNG